MNEIIVFVAVYAITLAGTYWLGRDTGKRLGRDEQWIDSYFANMKKLQSLRDELGQFKSKNQKTK